VIHNEIISLVVFAPPRVFRGITPHQRENEKTPHRWGNAVANIMPKNRAAKVSPGYFL